MELRKLNKDKSEKLNLEIAEFVLQKWNELGKNYLLETASYQALLVLKSQQVLQFYFDGKLDKKNTKKIIAAQMRRKWNDNFKKNFDLAWFSKLSEEKLLDFYNMISPHNFNSLFYNFSLPLNLPVSGNISNFLNLLSENDFKEIVKRNNFSDGEVISERKSLNFILNDDINTGLSPDRLHIIREKMAKTFKYEQESQEFLIKNDIRVEVYDTDVDRMNKHVKLKIVPNYAKNDRIKLNDLFGIGIQLDETQYSFLRKIYYRTSGVFAGRDVVLPEFCEINIYNFSGTELDYFKHLVDKRLIAKDKFEEIEKMYNSVQDKPKTKQRSFKL